MTNTTRKPQVGEIYDMITDNPFRPVCVKVVDMMENHKGETWVAYCFRTSSGFDGRPDGYDKASDFLVRYQLQPVVTA